MNLPPIINRVTKVGAQYLHIPNCTYTCDSCWKYIPDKHLNEGLCQEMSKHDTVKPYGYCTAFSYGNPVPNAVPRGAWEPAELGYGEEPDGTLCRNCEYFLGKQSKGPCQKVEGEVHAGGCCNNQEPAKEADHSVKHAHDLMHAYKQEVEPEYANAA